MRQIYVRLRSNEGDVLGHLVRAVQMLGSYGKEFELSSVSEVRHCGSSPPCAEVLLTAATASTPAEWKQVEREVLWSLQSQGGDQATLYLETAETEPALSAGPVLLSAREFDRMCRFGHTESLTPPAGQGEQPALE
jgi:hypothetical protein